MNNDTLRVLEQLSKASKHAHQLRSSLEKLLSLLPGAHETWHTMAQETRQMEQHLEAMHAIFEEMLQRDPASYAALLLSSEDAYDTAFPPSETQPKAVHGGVVSRRVDSSRPMKV